jgi:hypothetical protein
MTRRGKVVTLGVIGAIVVGCTIYVIAAAGPWRRHCASRAPWEQRVEEIGPLGVKQLASMSGTPPSDLKSACAGKLTAGAPQELLSFFGALPDKIRSDGELPRDQLYGFGTVPVDKPNLVFIGMPYTRDPYTMLSLWDFVFEKSRYWDQKVDEFRLSYPQADKARYLLVHRLIDWKLPEVLGQGSFQAGSALVHVRVIDLASGQQLCEGTVSPRMSDKITSHARGKTKESAQGMAQAQMHRGTMIGFAQSFKVAGLSALCELGGPTLCKATDEVIDKVDVFW